MTKPHLLPSAFLLLPCLASQAVGQSVIYVDADATGPVQDGSTWCDAFLTLREALGVATADTVIRVANGVYIPDSTDLADPLPDPPQTDPCAEP
jgi:hypothetical protein